MTNFIGSDVKKYLVNEDLEIRVGNDILKKVNSSLMFLIVDGDIYFQVCVTITDNINNCEKTICRTINTGCGISVPDPTESSIWKTKEKLKYRLITDYNLFLLDRLKAKLKNYHLYTIHTIFGDITYWWPKKPGYCATYLSLPLVYSHCEPHTKAIVGGPNLTEASDAFFGFNYFTHKPDQSYGDFYVGEDDLHIHGPYHLSWR